MHSNQVFILAALLAPALGSPLSKRAALDTDALATQYFGNDAPWYTDKIPFFTCSDQSIQDVYYYRWKLYRAHQRDLGERGYISTEFLDDVSWQLEPWGSLNDATGFHLNEGRWLRDRRYADDYINHMYEGGGNNRAYSDYMADAVYSRYLVDGDVESLTKHLDAMVGLYVAWGDVYDSSKGLYFIEPLADATEYTISSIDASCGEDGFGGGQAFRPSINSYMWANARAISKVAESLGQSDVATAYADRAQNIKENLQNSIWNETLGHFIDRHQTNTSCVTYWEPIRGRELVGYVPWMFGLPDDNTTYNTAWSHLLDSDKFRGSNGMRTNEPSYEYYMRQYRYDSSTGLPECQWNGPVWPYQETQVLLGMANLLNTYNQSVITAANYLDELRRYTQLHYLNTTTLDLQEDYYPDTEGPIVGLPRSHHYFHSGYNDLIITGLVGLRPRVDDTIEVNPLISADTDMSFRVQDVPYHGHTIAVEYSPSSGLSVEVDGEVVASSPTLTRLTAPITSASASTIDRSKIAKSVQLVRGEVPQGSASSGNETENIHEAIDGRVHFFSDAPNGWSSDLYTEDTEQWYAIEFGSTTEISSVELAFLADATEFVVPTEYGLQSWDGSQWGDLWSEGKPQIVENGITVLEGQSLSTQQVRIVFMQVGGKRTRLGEMKVF